MVTVVVIVVVGHMRFKTTALRHAINVVGQIIMLEIVKHKL